MNPPVVIPEVSVQEFIERELSSTSYSGPGTRTGPRKGMSDILAKFRVMVMDRALRLCDGNACRAAKMLGVHRNTMGRWMDEYELRGER